MNKLLLLSVLLGCCCLVAEATVYNIVTGWYKGRFSYYYDFGPGGVKTSGATVVAIPLFALVTGFNADGSPILVAGSHNIANITLGETGYSDLWQIIFYTVPATYVANTYKSQDEVIAAITDPAMRKVGPLVNCPIVPAGSTLDDGTPTTLGWCRGFGIEYFDFGKTVNYIIPLYKMPTVMDQHNIIDAVPEDGAAYSPFWEIYTIAPPTGYAANKFRSFADVDASGAVKTDQNMVVNCPVVKTDANVQPTDSSSTTALVASLALVFMIVALLF